MKIIQTEEAEMARYKLTSAWFDLGEACNHPTNFLKRQPDSIRKSLPSAAYKCDFCERLVSRAEIMAKRKTKL